MTIRLSACLIARDEEEFLPRCLASLAGVVDEICLLDTGSRDRTVEIAHAAHAVVGTRAWDQDFSAARNASLNLATGDWILQIDADEEIDPTSLANLRTDLEAGPPCRLVEVTLLDGTSHPGAVRLPRLFRRDDRIRYRRAVHESVIDSLADAGFPPPAPCRLRLIHHGYKPEILQSRGKHERNLSILRHARDLGNVDAYDLYKLATTLSAWDPTPERRTALESAWRLGMDQSASVRAQWPWWDRMTQTFAMQLLRQGEFSRAAELARQAIESTTTPQPLAKTALSEILLRSGYAAQAMDLAASATLELKSSSGLVATGGQEEAELEWIQARCAQACNLADRFHAHLDRSVTLGFLEAKCLLVGWKITQGVTQGWKDLDLLLRSDARQACVLLVASEASRSQGDRSTSDLLLQQAERIPSDAARLATCRLWMRGWLDGNTPSFDLPAFDLESTAIHGFLAMVRSTPWKPDPFLHVGALRSTLADMLESLLEAGHEGVLRQFAAGAKGRDADLPGISGLVEGA